MTRRSRNRNVVVMATPVINSQPSRRRRRRRGRRSGKNQISSPDNEMMSMTSAYFKSLVDPFEWTPPKLGWGCMVPTTIVSGYFRSVLTSSADGTLAILGLPCVTLGIVNSTGSASTVGWATSNYSNQSAIIAACGEGRVVSIGLRAYPNIALTAVPGAVYTGATVPTDWTSLQTLSPNDLIALPTSHLSIGVAGSSATGRPVDPDSFTFFDAIVDADGYTAAVNASETMPFSVPYIVFAGLPASSIVYVEGLINIEATQVVKHLAQTVLPDNAEVGSSRLCDYWPSFENMWGRIRPLLPAPGRPGESAASNDGSLIGSIFAGATRAATRNLLPAAGNVIGGALLNAGANAVNSAFGQRMLPRLAYGGSGQRYPNTFAGYLQ